MPSKRSEHELSIKTTVKDLASKELRHVGDEGKKSGESIAAGFIKAQLAIGAMKAAVRGAVNFIKGLTTDVAKQGDEMAKLSRRLGIGIETLSAFGYAAQLGGSNVQEMGNALKFLSKNAYESTAEGGGLATAKRAFDALGISVKDSSGHMKSAEQLFYDVADGMAQLGEGAKRTALAQQLFGRSGLTMIPIIEQGTAAIRAQIEEARRYGIVWTDTTGKIAEDFVDAQTRLDAAINGLKIAIGTQLLPVLTNGLNDIANYIADNRDEVTDIALDAVESVSKFVFDAVQFTAVSIAQLTDAVTSIASFLGFETQSERDLAAAEKELQRLRGQGSAAEILRAKYGPGAVIQSGNQTRINSEIVSADQAARDVEEARARLRKEIARAEQDVKDASSRVEKSLSERVSAFFDTTAANASATWLNTRIDVALDQFFDFEEPARKGGRAAGEAMADGVGEGISDATGKIADITREFQRQIDLLLAPDDMAREWLKVKQTLAEVVRQADLVGASAESVDQLYQTLLKFRDLSREGIIDKALADFFSFEDAIDGATKKAKKFDEVSWGRGGPPKQGPQGFTDAIGESFGNVQDLSMELGSTALPTLTSGFDSFFTSIESGSATAGQAFSAFAQTILQAVQRLAVQELVVQLLGAIFPSARTFGQPAQAVPVGQHAAGGIVTRPEIGLIGESGPEAVIPLNRMGELLRGGGDSTVVLNQTIVAPPGTDAKQFADTVIEGTLRKLRSSRGARHEIGRTLGGRL